MLSGVLAWLAYTRLYFVLHPAHLTFDPSLFMYLTGRPDPTCGLTRTFAWMWRGDIGRAARVYPLGPLIFVAVLGVAFSSALALVIGRRVVVRMGPTTRRILVAGAVLALLLNWVAKLVWLGM